MNRVDHAKMPDQKQESETTTSASTKRIKHRFTRIGIHFAFVATFAMVGGSLRGFNLLLVLAAFLVAILIVQWRVARGAIKLLDIRRRLPNEIFAGRPTEFRYTITNQGRLPAWMIRIVDHVRLVGRVSHKPFAFGIGLAPALGKEHSATEITITKRGLYELDFIELVTSFPFALLRSVKTVENREKFYVYPALLELHPDWHSILLGLGHGSSATIQRCSNSDGEFFGLRDWQSGDSPRWIHWRTSARTGELAVRQFEQQRQYDVGIVLDAFGDPTSKTSAKAVEFAVSIAATLITQFSSTTSGLSLVVSGSETRLFQGSQTLDGKHEMLRSLSVLQPAETNDFRAACAHMHTASQGVRHWIALSTRSFSAVSDDREHSAADSMSGSYLSHLSQSQRLTWVNVNLPRVRQIVQVPDWFSAQIESHNGTERLEVTV